MSELIQQSCTNQCIRSTGALSQLIQAKLLLILFNCTALLYYFKQSCTIACVFKTITESYFQCSDRSIFVQDNWSITPDLIHHFRFCPSSQNLIHHGQGKILFDMLNDGCDGCFIFRKKTQVVQNQTLTHFTMLDQTMIEKRFITMFSDGSNIYHFPNNKAAQEQLIQLLLCLN